MSSYDLHRPVLLHMQQVAAEYLAHLPFWFLRRAPYSIAKLRQSKVALVRG